MRKKYVKKGNHRSLDDYIYAKTGKHISQLDKYKSYYYLTLIPYIAQKIMTAIRLGKKIIVYADYDCDGITSACEFSLILDSLGATYTIKVPKRFTDGYGVKKKFTTTLGPDCLLILVDNGIAAIEAIAEAKRKGAEVIVMDHHMAVNNKGNIILPNADLLLDPEALPEGNDFTDYCGAGLTYKLAQYMLKDQTLIDHCTALAALGTIADMVPLHEDNRQIVTNGLSLINKGNATVGLQTLIQKLEYSGHVSSETVSFYIAPILNASGRLYDEGATWSALTLLESDYQKALNMADILMNVNKSRKEIVSRILDSIYIDPHDKVNVIATPAESPVGCLGLVAGKITEETKRTTFVYSNVNGIYKGSARSDDENFNHVKNILDSISEYFIAYGGHPGAAGFSFDPKYEPIIREKLLNYPVIPHDMTPYYDLDLQCKDIDTTLEELDKCEPFGKGLEKPTFAMNCHFNSDCYWKACGKDGEHIMFTIPGTNYKAIAFHMKDEYMRDGMPKNVRFIGNLNWNYYGGKKIPQFLIDDYEIC